MEETLGSIAQLRMGALELSRQSRTLEERRLAHLRLAQDSGERMERLSERLTPEERWALEERTAALEHYLMEEERMTRESRAKEEWLERESQTLEESQTRTRLALERALTILLSDLESRMELGDLIERLIILERDNLDINPAVEFDQAPPPANEDLVNHLPHITIHTDTVEDCCSVCCGEYVPGQVYSTLPCKHAFHRECIATWLLRSGTCPLCRHVVTPPSTLLPYTYHLVEDPFTSGTMSQPDPLASGTMSQPDPLTSGTMSQPDPLTSGTMSQP